MNGCIIVPIDGSDLSLRALDTAIDLSKNVSAPIRLVHVVDVSKAAVISYGDPEYVGGCLNALRDEGACFLQSACKRATERGAWVSEELLMGDPAEQIVRCAAQHDAEWIVMGSHGRSGLSHLLVGSVAEGVLRHSSVPVLIVPLKHDAARTSAA